MLDSGCTRTCIRQGESFISNLKPNPVKIKLLCANNEFMDIDGEVEVSMVFDSFSVNAKPLIVPGLSAPVILGLDVMESLYVNNDWPYAFVNDKILPLCDQIQSIDVKTESLSILEPQSDTIVNVKNPHFSKLVKNLSISISVEPLESQKFSDDVTVNPSIYANVEMLDVIVTNRTNRRIYLRGKKPLCSTIPIVTNRVNGIRELPNVIEESEMMTEFQSKRLAQAKSIKFVPKLGSLGDLDAEKVDIINDLVFKNRLCFSMDNKDLGRIGYMTFTIPMLDETDVAYQPPRAIPVHQRQQVREQIQSWLELGIIETTQSAYNIPLIILSKPDGSIRISLDARQLNQKIVQDRFPLAHMSSVFTEIGEKLSNGNECWISSFDWFRGYWNLRVDSEDAHKMAFSHEGNHYQSRRMLYGISSAPAAFSRLMMKIFGGHKSFVIYLDDVLIIDSSFEEHCRSLQFLFDQCQKFGILLNAKKCNLCQNTVTFLGHQVSKNGIQPTDKHRNAMQTFPRPNDRRSLKRFCGLANYNLKFVKQASVIMSPLYSICSTKKEFVWGHDQEAAFVGIKQALLSTHGLFHRNPKLDLVLVCDASKDFVGATLYQITENGEPQVVAYFSRYLSGPDQRRSMRIKELLALTYAIRHLEYYLLNTKFVVVSDHKSLCYLYREHMKSTLDAKLTNIFYYLLNFNFTIVHTKGDSELMKSADCLSRIKSSKLDELDAIFTEDDVPERIFALIHLPRKSIRESDSKMRYFLRSIAKGVEESPSDDAEEKTDVNVALKFEDYNISTEEMLKRQSNCATVEGLVKSLRKSEKKAGPKRRLNAKNFAIDDDGLLVNCAKQTKRIVLPDDIGLEFLKYVHTSFGHCGTYQLIKIVTKYFFIPKVKEKASDVCRLCVECLRCKPRPELRPSLIPKRSFESVPFEKTHVDLYDLGKADCHGKRYLMTAVDELTGYVEGFPLSNKTDRLVSKAMLELILRHGVSNRVITDNGAEFGPLFRAVLDRFQITHVRTSAYHSRSNGRVERIHREITSKMKLLQTKRQNWSDQWLFVKFLLNNLPKVPNDGLSATECLFGRSMHVPFQLVERIEGSREPYVKALNDYLTEMMPILMNQQYVKYAKLLSKDKNSAPILNVGQRVLMWKPDICQGKLTKTWIGPLRVAKRLSKDSYLLCCDETKRKYRRNIRLIRPIAPSAEHDVEENISQPDRILVDYKPECNHENKSNFFELPFAVNNSD